MKLGSAVVALLAAAALALAQQAPADPDAGIQLAIPSQQNQQPPPNPSQPQPTVEEQTAMMHAVTEGANSTVDLVRVFEEFLKKYPDTNYRPDIELNLLRASIENRDDARIVKYGELVLKRTPDEVIALDKVSMSLVALGGEENAQKAIKYARTLEDLIDKLAAPAGETAPQIQEERDRAEARTMLTQARARALLGDKEETRRLAERAYTLYPAEETGRVLAESLIRLGRNDEALKRLAEAFAAPDPHAADADRLSDRLRLGEMWKKAHGSEQGLGDEILAAYDRVSSAVELRRKKLTALDPNGAAKSVADFTIAGLDGKKLQMSSLQGKVLVLDFWATWCEPCRGQHPVYDEVMKHYANRNDVVFLPLNADDDRSVVEPFLESQMWDKHVYFEDGLQRVLGVSQIPTTIVLDRKEMISSRMNGFAPDRFKDDLIERIDFALSDSGGKPGAAQDSKKP